MVCKSLLCFLIVVLAFTTVSIPNHCWGQDPALTEQKSELKGTRKQLATIIFSGLAGAILGLSTLSFYGRPQDHLSNIAVGFAVGVISGTIYTTYQAATKPYEAFDYSLNFNDESFKRDLQIVSTQQKSLIGYSWIF